MNIRQIKDLFSYSSYETLLSLKETVILIDKINILTKNFFDNKYNLFCVKAPILFNANSGFNEDSDKLDKTKFILLNRSSIYSEISQGIRKWSLITAENIEINDLDCLYAEGMIVNSCAEVNNGYPPSYSVINITFPIDKKIIYNDFYNNLVQLFWEYYNFICYEVKRLCPKIKINNSKNIDSISIEKLLLNSESSFYKSILDLFEDENSNVFIKHIPAKNSDSWLFFAPDVYDAVLFSRFYKLNKYNSNLLNIAEISLSCDSHNLKNQLYLNYTYDKNISKLNDFQKLIMNGSVKKYGQILINMNNLYLLLLSKAHNGEVNSTIWDDYTYNLANNKKINLL